jgi:ATP-dependent Zn protease
VIDGEIHQLLEASRALVRETLTAQRGVLEALAKLLMEREVVDRQALTQLLAVEQSA